MVSEQESVVFALRRAVIGARDYVIISEDDVSALDAAIRGGREAVSFEDKYALLIDNYLELELSMLSHAATYMARPMLGDAEFAEVRRGINHRIVNFLTTSKLYIDQNRKHFPTLVGCTEKDVADLFAAEKAQSLSYRIVSALRNYVQHYDLPVHGVSLSSAWLGEGEDHRLRHGISATLRLQDLERDPQVPKTLLNELRGAGVEEIDLTRHIREFCSCIGRVHQSLRAKLEPHVTEWKAVVEAAMKKFHAVQADQISLGLAAVKQLSESRYEPLFNVHTVSFDRLAELQRLNYCNTNLERQYVSSELLKKKGA